MNENLTPNAWIDRGGRFHPLDYAGHDTWAREYLIDKYGEEKAYALRKHPRRKIPFFEILENYGWVKIISWPTIKTEFFFKENDITHAQKQTIDKYCRKFHLPLPFKDPLFN